MKIEKPPIIFLSIACGSEQEDKQDEDCVDFTEFDELTDIDERLEWLSKNGENICLDDVFEDIIDTHIVKNTGNMTMLPGRSLVKEWSDLQPLLGNFNYKSYLSPKVDPANDDIVNVEPLGTFSKTKICFSPPLFRSIVKKHGLGGKSIFKFMNAQIEGKKTIVIEIGGQTATYYDYSQIPK